MEISFGEYLFEEFDIHGDCDLLRTTKDVSCGVELEHIHSHEFLERRVWGFRLLVGIYGYRWVLLNEQHFKLICFISCRCYC